MYKSHASYRKLRMGRREILDRYISHLENLYTKHRIWQQAEKLASLVLQASNEHIKETHLLKFDALDIE